GIQQHLDRGVCPAHAPGREIGEGGRIARFQAALTADPDDLAGHGSRFDSNGHETGDRLGGLCAVSARDYRRAAGFGGRDSLLGTGRLFNRAPRKGTATARGAFVIRRTALFVLLLGATSSLAQGQPQSGTSGAASGTALTLAQAEATALRNSPQITIGKLRELVAQQYVRE